MKRILIAFMLLAIGAVGGIALFLIGLIAAVDPHTLGLSAKDYEEGTHAGIAPRDVIAPASGDLEEDAGGDRDKNAAESPKGGPHRNPNIIIILADDLGYGDVGVYGGRAIQTPNIDRLASEGLRFSHAYASAAICSPSRAGLLTGRYPLRTGVMTAMQMAGDSLARKASYQAGIVFSALASVDLLGGGNQVRGLPPSEVTIPEALGVAGYRSMAIGKWHLGDFTVWPDYHPFNHGFDEFVGFNGSNDDFPIAFWRDDQEVLKDVGADQEKYTGLFTDEAVGFIEREAARQDEHPFFLYLAHKDPHLPFFPSEAFAGKSDGGPYGDAVSEFDASVGTVIDALRREGLEKNTLVILTSDNGPWFDGSPGAFRGRKGQSYEGGFRVPMIAWWPGRIAPGSESSAPVMNIDFLPTFLSLAGLSPPSDRTVDGRDLSPLFFAAYKNGAGTDPDIASSSERDARSVFDERALYFFHEYDVEAIRKGEWKFYRTLSHYTWPVPLDKPESFFAGIAGARDYQPESGGEPIPTLGTWPNLYHLGRDPGEAYNVVETFPDIARDLETELEAWREDFYNNPRGWN